MKKKKLCIIIPIYNEENTLRKLIEKVQEVNINSMEKELIVVNDASSDNSVKIIEEFIKKYKNISLYHHKNNRGKGAAIRTGLKHTNGDFVVIQDGDLEYNPEDFNRLLKPLLEGKTEVVYGSRMLGNISGFNISSHYYGNIFLTFITKILYGQGITDMETCYKMMTVRLAKSLKLKANKFDIEPEITSKIIKKGHKILEIPINYKARSFEEGKKIHWKDGISALLTLIKYRFFN